MSGQEKPDVGAVLAGLKDFQRASVDYVHQRLYEHADSQRRFLVADEVGLGKTLVARGVIAKAVETLWDEVERIDIVYICSNGDIARQNVNRLNISGRDDVALASRITLLPTQLHDLKDKRLNFISFTPGTSLDQRSSMGVARERALLHVLLDSAWGFGKARGALKVLQGGSELHNFEWRVREMRDTDIDESLAERFIDELREHNARLSQAGRPTTEERFSDLCGRFKWMKGSSVLADEDRRARRDLISELRMVLAGSCVTALEPDLVILDEFQRFKRILAGDDPAAQLARELFNYQDFTTGAMARVLLLSATPYKMYTLNDEVGDEDHYRDFIETVRFLNDDDERTASIASLVQRYRRALFRIGAEDWNSIRELKGELEAELRRIMVRTERLAVSDDRNGMLYEVPVPGVELVERDLTSYLSVQKVASAVGQPDILEYWKSGAYLLNFMESYKVKEKFRTAIESDGPVGETVFEALRGADGTLLQWDEVARYGEVDPGNARLRALVRDLAHNELWRLLWMPPALPYHELGAPFARAAAKGATKRLIFSGWQVAPKVIATVISYLQERDVMRSAETNPENTTEARERRARLLDFRRRDGVLGGMPVLALVYPSPTLAQVFDPLAIAADEGGMPSLARVVELATERAKSLLAEIEVEARGGPPDEAWYWAAPIMLDYINHADTTRAWFSRRDLASAWSGGDSSRAVDGSGWADHVATAREVLEGAGRELGPQPDDLAEVVAYLALAAPGTVALRALSRQSRSPLAGSELPFRDAAGRIAWGFRSLFNVPEVTALVRGLFPGEPYWRRLLEYSANGCIQAVMDEYVHVLVESLGLTDKPEDAVVAAIAEEISASVSVRAASLTVDDVVVDTRARKVKLERKAMRARFAARFGQETSDDGGEVTRADQVRKAFNSPFWPFVLATTSVGQEGLDFHPYCHAVVHWNLPSNPVDLEQREGRVHRYKGHAIRKNVAARFGLLTVSASIDDPWRRLFELAYDHREPGENDMVPFWIYPLEDGARIERHVPTLPLSREVGRLAQLRKSLAVYRMAFGQSRQEDLISYLLTQVAPEERDRAMAELKIDLAPPGVG